MDYREAVGWLRGLINYEAIGLPKTNKPTLERIERLMSVLGDPHTATPTVHVTGTNGKGSTVRMVTALIAEHNLAVGGYSSPHIERINERITINNEPLSDEDFAAAVESVATVSPMAGVEPTYFDAFAAAAYSWFALSAVDAAVVEVGLGGRWDSTNVVDADVAVVTNVGTDHAEIIGPTRADIAAEKAGIVGERATLVLGEDDPDLLPVFEARSPERLWLAGRDYELVEDVVAVGGRAITVETPFARHEQVYIPLHGAHQARNAASAITAAEAFFDRPLDPEVLASAMAGVTNPGRFEVANRHPLVLLDGAHNLDGAAAAAATLAEDFHVSGDFVLVMGMNSGHDDPAAMLEALGARRARLVIGTNADWPKAIPAAKIAGAARGLGVDAEAVGSVIAAVDRAMSVAGEDGVVLVVGSLYVVGEARPYLLSSNPTPE